MKTSAFFMVVLSASFCFAQEKQKSTTNYLPNVSQGEKLYQSNCSVCHGAKGMSDTPVGKTLKKKPAAIGDPVLLNRLSPEKVYDLMTHGMEDKGMPSFKHLKEKERWDLAAYVFTLNCNSQKPTADMRPSLSWTETKDQTDLQIVEILRKRGVPDTYLQKELAASRYLLE